MVAIPNALTAFGRTQSARASNSITSSRLREGVREFAGACAHSRAARTGAETVMQNKKKSLRIGKHSHNEARVCIPDAVQRERAPGETPDEPRRVGRRTCLALLGGILAFPLAAPAKPAERVRRL